jgi:hypothetical protein
MLWLNPLFFFVFRFDMWAPGLLGMSNAMKLQSIFFALEALLHLTAAIATSRPHGQQQ